MSYLVPSSFFLSTTYTWTFHGRDSMKTLRIENNTRSMTNFVCEVDLFTGVDSIRLLRHPCGTEGWCSWASDTLPGIT